AIRMSINQAVQGGWELILDPRAPRLEMALLDARSESFSAHVASLPTSADQGGHESPRSIVLEPVAVDALSVPENFTAPSAFYQDESAAAHGLHDLLIV